MTVHRDNGNRTLSFLSGLGIGATALYLLDPDNGRRRRALTRDKLIHGTNAAREMTRKGVVDLEHRMEGLAHDARELTQRGTDVGDHVLIERVRARMGRIVSHPGAVSVRAQDGRVVLSGPILANEADRFVREVRKMHEVHDVEDQLERHDSPGRVPGLQGGVERNFRRGFMQERWAPRNRLIAIGAGTALAGFGLAQRGLLGGLAAGAGGALVARAVSNLPLRLLLGIGEERRGIDFTKHVHIDAPPHEVFLLLGDLESYPRFMEHVREVRRIDDRRSHWVVEGPGGAPIGFDSEITSMVQDQVIAWRSAPGAVVKSAGIIQLEPDPRGGTRVDIRMSYTPPAGALGHAIASFFRVDPKHALDDDMVRLKSLIELGKTRAHGHAVRRDDIGR